MQTKTFPLRVLLTVTTGRLLTESRGPRDNGISDLYDILGWMTNDSPYTHQLERFREECRRHLYRQWPELGIAEASLKSLDCWINRDMTGGEEGIKMWLTEIKMMQPLLKDTYEVSQILSDKHVFKNPLEELIETREKRSFSLLYPNP